MARVAAFILLLGVLQCGVWTSLYAQDITGYWQGVLYQDFPSGTVYHPLSMTLVQNGTDVTGTSEILWATDPSYYGIMSLEGTFDGILFSFQELAILDQNPHPSAVWCIKRGDLIYDDVNQILEGPWDAPSCYPGTVELHRLTVSDTVFCIGDTVSIEVTGINIRWYADPELTQFLDTGNIFYPGITTTDTFYVTQTHYFTESPAIAIQIIISAPELDSIMNSPNGCGASDGTITLSAKGGIPEYLFAIDGGPFQTDPTFSGLSEGIYTVTIMDAHGCTAIDQVEILKSIPPQIDSLIAPSIPCGGNNTSITVFANGGTGTLMYQLNGALFQSDPLFSGIPPGVHTLIVIDEKGCRDTASISIDTMVSPILTGVLGISPICTNNNGSLTIQVAGGNGPISFALSGSAFQTSPVFSNLSAGFYEVVIMDSLGCVAKDSFQLVAIDSLIDIETDITPASCRQGNGGLIVLATGTTGTLSYTLGQFPPQGSPEFMDLLAGSYPLMVSDGNGCTGIDTVEIPETPAPFLALFFLMPTQCGLDNGLIEVTAFHSLSVEFTLNNGPSQSTGIFPNLGPGLYQIAAMDSMGCSSQLEVVVEPSSAPEIGELNLQNTQCGQANGSIAVEVQGGWPPLSYALDGGMYQSAAVFSSLGEGTYLVQVKDQDGCTDELEAVIEGSDALLWETVTITDADCDRLSGQIEAVAMGGSGALMYSLNNGPEQTIGLFPNLPQGNYLLQVRDEAGCLGERNVVLGEIPCNLYIPNGFSPNGDGINDDFRIYGPGISGAMIVRYTVWDRWGNLIYEQKNFPLDSQEPIWWDGTFRGKPLDNGVVIYVVELEFASGETRIYKGDLTVVR